MKVNFTDAITITQLFQNDIKENHIKSLSSTERRVCMASFRILKERTIDNAPKKEHKHPKQKIIQNITDKLKGLEPAKGKKGCLHKINFFFKGIANRFFRRISSSKIIIAMTAYNADLNNAKVEIKKLEMNIQNEEAELKTSNEEYKQIMDDYFKEIGFERDSHIMATVFKSTHLSAKFSQNFFDELPGEHKFRLARFNLDANFMYRRFYETHPSEKFEEKIYDTSWVKLDKLKVTKDKMIGLKKIISRLYKQVEIRNKK